MPYLLTIFSNFVCSFAVSTMTLPSPDESPEHTTSTTSLQCAS